MDNSHKVEHRPLGSQGLVASAQGFGAMGLTAFYKGGDTMSEDDKIKTIGELLSVGINLIDTAWIYQDFSSGDKSEVLIGKALKKYGRDNFVVATKFGVDISTGKQEANGKPEFVRKQCEESLKNLDIPCIDLYYMHRMDRNTPIEDTMKCLLELKNEGKIKYVGLSECTSDELERAHKVIPISAIQMEWSLQTRDIEHTILPTARKLGVAIVCYSPLGRGFLSRTFTKKEELKSDDYRSTLPRFNDENFDKNAKAAENLEEFAKKKGFSSAQIALAWLHAQGNDVFPIPGTRTVKRIIENSRAATITLTKEEVKEIEEIIGNPEGDRYGEEGMKKTHNSGTK